MTSEALKTPVPGLPVSHSERKFFKCPSCSAVLYSPYHTICPVCAETIELETLETALGSKAEVVRGGAGVPWVAIAVGALIVVALIVAIVANR